MPPPPDHLATVTAMGQRHMTALRTIQTMLEQEMDRATISTLLADLRHQLANDFSTIQYYVYTHGDDDDQTT